MKRAVQLEQKLSKSEHKNFTVTQTKMMITLIIRNKRIIIRKWQLHTVCIIQQALCKMRIIGNKLAHNFKNA
jgi:hypothetical protein